MKMISKIFLLVYGLCSAMFASAATAKLLLDGDLKGIAGLQIISYTSQTELGAQYDNIDSIGGIAVMPEMLAVQSGQKDAVVFRQINALFKLAPYHHLIDGQSINKTIEDKLKKEVQLIPIENISFSSILPNEKLKKKKIFSQYAKENKASLFIETNYSISENGQQIHFVANANLYVPSKKRSHPAPMITKWAVVWQSKSRNLEWALPTSDWQKKLISEAEEYYLPKIKKAKKTEKKILKRKLKQAIKKLEEASALKHNPRISNVKWEGSSLAETVHEGVGFAVQHLIDSFINPISDTEFKAKSRYYPYAKDSTHKYNKQKDKNIVDVKRLPIDGYNILHSDENIRYLIPQGEIIWLPFKDMVFKPEE